METILYTRYDNEQGPDENIVYYAITSTEIVNCKH